MAAARWETVILREGNGCQRGRPSPRSRWPAWHPALGGGAAPSKAYTALDMNMPQNFAECLNWGWCGHAPGLTKLNFPGIRKGFLPLFLCLVTISGTKLSRSQCAHL